MAGIARATHGVDIVLSARGLFRLTVAVLVLVLSVPASAQESETDVIYLFWGDGCPHCEAEWEFLGELQNEFPDLVVHDFEVWYDEANRALFADVMAGRGMEARSVPTTLFNDWTWVGFDDARAAEIRNAVAAAFGAGVVTAEPGHLIDLPLVGPIDVGSQSLVVSTLLIGFVDGFNPCSLWVLSILLALVLRGGSRRRLMAVGGTFLAITTLLYGLYIAGLYGALSYAAHATWIRLVMAAVALAFGIVNIKDYFWFKRGVSLTIPDASKPKLYERMRRVSEVDRPLPAALAGTAALAVGVSLLETPCTAGYPVLWANLLSEQGVGWSGALVLFGLYMLVFLIDELAVFGTAVVAMRVTKVEERAGRVLKLIGGVLMVLLAATLIFVPTAMESVSGALGVFLVAAGITAAVLIVDRWLGRRRGERPEGRRLPADR